MFLQSLMYKEQCILCSVSDMSVMLGHWKSEIKNYKYGKRLDKEEKNNTQELFLLLISNHGGVGAFAWDIKELTDHKYSVITEAGENVRKKNICNVLQFP